MNTMIEQVLRAWACMVGMGFLGGAVAQDLDILIDDGHVVDPKNGISAVRDVGIADGIIVEVSTHVDPSRAARVVDASGLYVTPGLVDMHVHVFHGTMPDQYLANSYSSVPPDGFTFRSGVTTAVDVGGAGWRTIRTFIEQTVHHSNTRVLAFLNIVGEGMKGGAIEQNLADMDPKLTAMAARQHSDVVVGVKLAHYQGARLDAGGSSRGGGPAGRHPRYDRFWRR